MDFDEHPLWKFSLAVYGAPGVSAACLDLQERRGADVNLLLYAAFVGISRRGRLTSREIERCCDAVRPWTEHVVTGLRRVRRALKADLGAITADRAAPLRRQIAALELQAEQLEQQALAACLTDPPAGATDSAMAASDGRAEALANMRIYLQTLAAPDESADAAALATIISALPLSV
jgi:uncharacterized protein (TIGR02444 family)